MYVRVVFTFNRPFQPTAPRTPQYILILRPRGIQVLWSRGGALGTVQLFVMFRSIHSSILQVLLLYRYAVVADTFQLNPWKAKVLPSTVTSTAFWTSRGHRCLRVFPSPPPVYTCLHRYRAQASPFLLLVHFCRSSPRRAFALKANKENKKKTPCGVPW